LLIIPESSMELSWNRVKRKTPVQQCCRAFR
jgi:hypothetical protein